MSKKDYFEQWGAEALENQHFKETIVVLYKLINEKENVDTKLDKIGDAISDVIFGHSIRSKEYLTDDEFVEAVEDIEKLASFKECWNE